MFNEKIFDTFFSDAEDLFNEFNKKINKLNKEGEKNNNNEEDYYHFLSNRYENGKCVEHKEKIVDNGKVIKDEHGSIEDKKEEQRTIGSEVIKAKNKEIEDLKAEIKKLTDEKHALKEKIAQVRKMFN